LAFSSSAQKQFPGEVQPLVETAVSEMQVRMMENNSITITRIDIQEARQLRIDYSST